MERAKEKLFFEGRIRLRAYELYVQRGKQSGSELDDWLQAEEQIQQGEVPKAERKEKIGVGQSVRKAFAVIFFLSAFLRRLGSRQTQLYDPRGARINFAGR